MLKELGLWLVGLLGVVITFAIFGLVVTALWALKLVFTGRDPVESIDIYDPYDFPRD